METTTTTNGLDEILFLVPEGEDEAELFIDFARIDEPLVAVLKHSPAYKHPHIEIRKERS